jgi:hypothetical protein
MRPAHRRARRSGLTGLAFALVGNGVPDPTIPSEVTNYFGIAAETDLRQHAMNFVDAAKAAADEVTFTPHQGIHTWHYHFAKPPAEVETFTRHGPKLAGEGSGTVTLRLPGGCRVSPTLPFTDLVVPC